MILSRVIGHFRKQEWTAIFLDFVIVVAGILIAFQITEWNTARQDRAREISYLTRIRADLQGDIDGLAERQRYWADVAAAGRMATGYAETGALVDGSAWKTVRSFFWASNVWFYSPNDTAFSEMSGAGDVTLIRSEKLRIALSNYYSNSAKIVRAVVYTAIPAYRQAVRGATPIAVASYIVNECHSHGPVNQRMLDCPAPVSEAEAAKILEVYLAHPLLVDGLRFWITNLDQLAQSVEPDTAAATALAAAIDSELAK
ncbi:MAG: hypothetical protein A3E78_12755 [Alphaproteobacteria bacterium RIFCSPHIGHO2_12_FULL_63_12]|nr:MAG: hypothetical protein A3E78_12755 [Alphaproteobacteria bacterium RIFCSPHIGHO2_12_FULL_63_12]